MILDDDKNIQKNMTITALEYRVAQLLYDFMNNNLLREKFKDLSFRPQLLNDYDTTSLTELCEINTVFSTAHVKRVDRQIKELIKKLSSQLPEPLYLNYEYTTFEGFNEYRQQQDIIRSGYIVEISSPKELLYKFHDSSTLYTSAFYLKFRILGERNLYDSSFYLPELQVRFNKINNAENIVKYLDKLKKTT